MQFTLLQSGTFSYLANRDIAAVLAMFTTLEMWGIFELVCTVPALPQARVASSAACWGRALIIKIQMCNCTPAAPFKRGYYPGYYSGDLMGAPVSVGNGG